MVEHAVRSDETFVLPVAHRAYRSAQPLGRGVRAAALLAVALAVILQVLLLADREAPPLELAAFFVHVSLVIMGLTFFVRLRNNGPALDVPMRWNPFWAWLGWLIPVVWWVIPYFVVRELWHSGAPPDQPSARTPPLLSLWWLLWVASGVLNWSFVAWSAVHGIDPGHRADIPTTLLVMDTASTVLAVAALGPFLALAKALPQRQDERRQALAGPQARATGTF